ncbi:MAG: acyl-CoA dehydrogenase family protein [Microbacterium sp.]|jgi:acyl-CoA dehydrogenase|uniref:acyl-CoA dehydrogenase family protein n=1 Tax=Microbacterium sp. TaxID=51671 RepID=UPI00271CF480|nr:acyl-CoA dehydrogenase family protein [Microbacterium sp.]MDO8381481.1 acyl-CoA dehydrogenase family protein [Microbacterium sp.]
MDTEDLEQILGAVRSFVRDQVVPREGEIEEADAIPDVLRSEAAKMGLFGWAIPEEYGGLGLNATEDARLAFELGYTTPSFRSLFGTNNGIAGQVLVNYGTEEQKNRWLPRIASGQVITSFALTEVEAGSDPSGIRTSARRDGDGYVINGSKRFITNAALAHLLIVFARTDPEAKGTKGISAFLVDTDTAGVTVGPHDKKMGQEGAWTSEVFFDDVEVAADRLVGGAEEVGFHAAMASLAKGRLHIAAICVGQAQRILDESVAYAAQAKQGGRSIGTFQLVQAMLADSYTELLAGRELVLGVARRYDSGEDRKLGPSAAKLFCSEMLGRVADRGVQVHGGMGYMRSVAVERFYRAARLFRIYEGTSEIQRVVIARQLLGPR